MTAPLDAYLRHLVIERGLSKNTLSAYKADLAKYRDYLDQNSFSELSITRSQLSDFLQWLNSQNLRAASSARILAAVRGYQKYLLLENLRTDDPSQQVKSPKLPKRLPKALTQAQVMALLSASGPEPDDETADVLRLRNRAILELMYSSGCRVSEVAQLDLDEMAQGGWVRIRGKGSKERLVPLSQL